MAILTEDVPSVVRVPAPDSVALEPVTLNEPSTLTFPDPPNVPACKLRLLSTSPAPLAVSLPPLRVKDPAREDVVVAPLKVSSPPEFSVKLDPATEFRPLTVMPLPASVTWATGELM